MSETLQLTQDQLDRIRDLAYEKFLARGCEDGRDLEDWIAAEQEVLACDADEEGITFDSSCQTPACTSKSTKELVAV